MSKIKKFISNKSPILLTITGSIGVVVTAVAAVDATIKATPIIESNKELKGKKLTIKETIRTAGKYYIPSILIGCSTIACIFGANALNKRSQAALTSAYAMLDQTYKTYRGKIDDVLGEGSDKRVLERIAVDKYDDTPKESDKELFFDSFGLRFFNSTMREVTEAAKAVRDKYELDGSAHLSDFYECLGIDPYSNEYSDGWGFSFDEEFFPIEDMNFSYEKSITDSGEEFWIINMPMY